MDSITIPLHEKNPKSEISSRFRRSTWIVFTLGLSPSRRTRRICQDHGQNEGSEFRNGHGEGALATSLVTNGLSVLQTFAQICHSTNVDTSTCRILLCFIFHKLCRSKTPELPLISQTLEDIFTVFPCQESTYFER